MGNREGIIAQIDRERANGAVLKLQAARDGMVAVEKFRSVSAALKEMEACGTGKPSGGNVASTNDPVQAANDPPPDAGQGDGPPSPLGPRLPLGPFIAGLIPGLVPGDLQPPNPVRPLPPVGQQTPPKQPDKVVGLPPLPPPLPPLPPANSTGTPPAPGGLIKVTVVCRYKASNLPYECKKYDHVCAPGTKGPNCPPWMVSNTDTIACQSDRHHPETDNGVAAGASCRPSACGPVDEIVRRGSTSDLCGNPLDPRQPPPSWLRPQVAGLAAERLPIQPPVSNRQPPTLPPIHIEPTLPRVAVAPLAPTTLPPVHIDPASTRIAVAPPDPPVASTKPCSQGGSGPVTSTSLHGQRNISVGVNSQCRSQWNPMEGVTQGPLALANPPSHGSVTIQGAALVYKPNPGYRGSDTFVISVAFTNSKGDFKGLATYNVTVK